MTNTTTATISDRLEIEQLLVRYCYAVDERDWDAYRSVYTEDAVIDDVSAGPGRSVDEMVEFLSWALEKVVTIQQDGYARLSLAVVDGGRAAHLYRRLGFRAIDASR
jgi:hypothetical protein